MGGHVLGSSDRQRGHNILKYTRFMSRQKRAAVHTMQLLHNGLSHPPDANVACMPSLGLGRCTAPADCTSYAMTLIACLSQLAHVLIAALPQHVQNAADRWQCTQPYLYPRNKPWLTLLCGNISSGPCAHDVASTFHPYKLLQQHLSICTLVIGVSCRRANAETTSCKNCTCCDNANTGPVSRVCSIYQHEDKL
jgi:hypothetical protein